MPKDRNPINYDDKHLDARTVLSDITARAQASCCITDDMIGERLRRLRKEKGLSIRSLANRCGISANTLSLIENDRTSPSLHTLGLLTNGLEIPLIALFEADEVKPALIYQKDGQRPQVRFASGTLENLGEGVRPLGAEPILVTLDVDQAEASDISHNGREFIYCLEGLISCFIKGVEYRLSPGDSLYFEARAPHHWKNNLTLPSRLLVLFCSIESHDQPAEHHLGL